MWLVGVVVRRYIDNLIILLIPTPLVLVPFLQLYPYFFVHLKNVLSFLEAMINTPFPQRKGK